MVARPLELVLRDMQRREDGVVALHLSNRYLRLEPVAARIGQELGLAGLQVSDLDRYDPNGSDADENRIPGKQNSQWLVLARKPEYVKALLSRPDTLIDRGRKVELSDHRWYDMDAKGAPLWTDDFSNILSVINWD